VFAVSSRSGTILPDMEGLSRAGHFLLLEQPEAVTRAVTEFVGTGAVTRSLLARDEPRRSLDRSRLKPVRAVLSLAGQQLGTVRCAVMKKPAEEPGFGVGSCVAEDTSSSGSVLAKLGLYLAT
jgi:hypothetical protein